MKFRLKPTSSKQKQALASFLIDSAKGVFLIVIGMLLESSIQLPLVLLFTAVFILLLVYGILVTGEVRKEQRNVLTRRS